jgi:hypothetical protein
VPKPKERMGLIIQCMKSWGILENKGHLLKYVGDTFGIIGQRM